VDTEIVLEMIFVHVNKVGGVIVVITVEDLLCVSTVILGIMLCVADMENVLDQINVNVITDGTERDVVIVYHRLVVMESQNYILMYVRDTEHVFMMMFACVTMNGREIIVVK